MAGKKQHLELETEDCDIKTALVLAYHKLEINDIFVNDIIISSYMGLKTIPLQCLYNLCDMFIILLDKSCSLWNGVPGMEQFGEEEKETKDSRPPIFPVVPFP